MSVFVGPLARALSGSLPQGGPRPLLPPQELRMTGCVHILRCRSHSPNSYARPGSPSIRSCMIPTQRLLCSSFLVMTYFLLRDYKPKKKLRSSLWANNPLQGGLGLACMSQGLDCGLASVDISSYRCDGGGFSGCIGGCQNAQQAPGSSATASNGTRPLRRKQPLRENA